MDDLALADVLSRLGSHWGELAAIAGCFLVLAFSSASEAALMRMEPGRTRQLLGQRRRGARQLSELVAKRGEVLSSLVLLINLAIIVGAAYTTEVTIALSGGSTRWVPVTSVGMIAALLVLGEVAPKTYGLRRAERTALALAPLLKPVHAAVNPISRLLHALALVFSRRLLVPIIGGQATPEGPLYSDEEVLELVDAGEADGDIEEDEKDMIRGVIEFADKVAREVMTPRTDMVCIQADTTLADTAQVSKDSGYSRLPVYEDDVDHIIGIVYAKDMVSALQTDGGDLKAGDVARTPAPVVPESKKLSEVLRLMQRNRLHMAIVLDEYGGTSGLVTIEDLLEEIFGEIRDEHDLEAEPVWVVDDATLVVDARVSTDELTDLLGVALPEGEYDSVGGFVLDQLGRLPGEGEVVKWENLTFTVESVSEQRVERVRIVRTPREGSNGEEEAAEQD